MKTEINKINSPKINLDFDPNSIIEEIIGSTNAGTEELLLEITKLGLEHKGFEFSTRAELKNFISTRCKMVLSRSREIKTLLVDDQPFVSFLEKVEHIELGNNKWWFKNSLDQVEYL